MAAAKFAIAEENGRAILAMLDHQRARAHLHHLARSARQAVVAGQHLGLAIVDQQHVHALQHLVEIRAVPTNPVIHGVAADQLYLLHGIADAGLQHGIDVGQKQKIGIVILVRDRRLKRFEHIQLGVQRLGFVDILAVFAGPVEGLALRVLDAARVYAALVHHGFVVGREVLADYCDHTHVGEIAGAQRKICGRAAQDLLALAIRGFQGIECDGTDDQDGQSMLPLSVRNRNTCRPAAAAAPAWPPELHSSA